MIWLRILAGVVAALIIAALIAVAWIKGDDEVKDLIAAFGVFAGIVAGATGLICLIVFAAGGTEMFS